jgi:hypothetical protein
MSLMLSQREIGRVWEDARRSGALSQLYHENVDDWRLLKCGRVYARHVGEIRNAKLLRLLGQIFAWIRVRMSDAYRRTRERLRELSQAGKFRVGVWGSAGLRGELLRFYLGLKNGSVPAALLMDLYS